MEGGLYIEWIFLIRNEEWYPILNRAPSPISSPLFQVHRKYTAVDFDDDLRNVLRRSGCRDEKIVFVMDESNVLDSSFLERMNTLLANGEVGKCITEC